MLIEKCFLKTVVNYFDVNMKYSEIHSLETSAKKNRFLDKEIRRNQGRPE